MCHWGKKMLNSLIGFSSLWGVILKKETRAVVPSFYPCTRQMLQILFNIIEGGQGSTAGERQQLEKVTVGRDMDLGSARAPPPACTLINLSPPIQTGALADHCCDTACGLERLLEGDARKPRTLVGLQTLPWQQGREWDAGGRPRESWEKKDAARKISADHLCKTNEGGGR